MLTYAIYCHVMGDCHCQWGMGKSSDNEIQKGYGDGSRVGSFCFLIKLSEPQPIIAVAS